MPEFRFSMIVDGVERVQYVEIPQKELEHMSPLFPEGHSFSETYRQNVIQRKLNEWALSKIKLTQWEVNTDESKSSS